MMTHTDLIPWLKNLNALVGGLFLLTAFGLVAIRQVQSCLRLFITQSILLAISALLLGVMYHTWHLMVVSAVDIITKPIIVPWLLRRSLRDEVYTRREVTQVLNIPTALLIALALTIVAYLLAKPLLAIGTVASASGLNLPISFAVLLIGAFTTTARREALPVLFGLLAMENAAFFAGIAIAPEMPLIAEVAAASDVLIVVFLISVLTRAVHEKIGTTKVATLTTLKEETKK